MRDDWVYASVRVRGLTRFHVALVQFVLSAGNANGNGGQAMRRAGHAVLARALGGSLPNPCPMRLVKIEGLIAVHGRAEAGCPPLRGGLHFPLSRTNENPKSKSLTQGSVSSVYLIYISYPQKTKVLPQMF